MIDLSNYISVVPGVIYDTTDKRWSCPSRDLQNLWLERLKNHAEVYTSVAPYVDRSNSLRYWHGGNQINVSVTLNLGEWNHIAYTVDGANLKVYFNGVEVGSTTSSSTNSRTAMSFEIGGDNWGSHSSVHVDEVSFWKRPLSAEEIFTIYDTQN